MVEVELLNWFREVVWIDVCALRVEREDSFRFYLESRGLGNTLAIETECRWGTRREVTLGSLGCL